MDCEWPQFRNQDARASGMPFLINSPEIRPSLNGSAEQHSNS